MDERSRSNNHDEINGEHDNEQTSYQQAVDESTSDVGFVVSVDDPTHSSTSGVQHSSTQSKFESSKEKSVVSAGIKPIIMGFVKIHVFNGLRPLIEMSQFDPNDFLVISLLVS